jgi:hypothetical protein
VTITEAQAIVASDSTGSGVPELHTASTCRRNTRRQNQDLDWIRLVKYTNLAYMCFFLVGDVGMPPLTHTIASLQHTPKSYPLTVVSSPGYP